MNRALENPITAAKPENVAKVDELAQAVKEGDRKAKRDEFVTDVKRVPAQAKNLADDIMVNLEEHVQTSKLKRTDLLQVAFQLRDGFDNDEVSHRGSKQLVPSLSGRISKLGSTQIVRDPRGHFLFLGPTTLKCDRVVFITNATQEQILQRFPVYGFDEETEIAIVPLEPDAEIGIAEASTLWDSSGESVRGANPGPRQGPKPKR